MKIILLRHGKPKLASSQNMSAYAFKQWIKDYDNAELCLSSLPPQTTLEQVKADSVFICSELRRSIHSAKVLNSQKKFISNAMFNEAEMPSAAWQLPNLPAQIWAILFRIAWRLGFTASGKVESFQQASSRAKVAANEIIRHAELHNDVILVGHGIFNRLLAKQLKASNWSLVKPLGKDYWSYGVFQKGAN